MVAGVILQEQGLHESGLRQMVIDVEEEGGDDVKN